MRADEYNHHMCFCDIVEIRGSISWIVEVFWNEFLCPLSQIYLKLLLVFNFCWNLGFIQIETNFNIKTLLERHQQAHVTERVNYTGCIKNI